MTEKNGSANGEVPAPDTSLSRRGRRGPGRLLDPYTVYDTDRSWHRGALLLLVAGWDRLAEVAHLRTPSIVVAVPCQDVGVLMPHELTRSAIGHHQALRGQDTDPSEKRLGGVSVGLRSEPRAVPSFDAATDEQATDLRELRRYGNLWHGVPPSLLDHNHYLMVVKSLAMQEAA